MKLSQHGAAHFGSDGFPLLGDLVRDGGQLYLRFGSPPAPVPEPFAAMIGGT